MDTMAEHAVEVIATFEVERRGYLEIDGKPRRGLPAFAGDRDLVVALYRAMVLARAFDMKAVSLQRTGRLGTYATSLGQEAVAVGVASAMAEHDVLIPSYRDNAALLWRGVAIEDILLFWGGDERGNRGSGPVQDLPFCIPVGSQAPHAAGVGYALKYRKQNHVAVCLLGDGATSKGDVYEAMNFAGVAKLPVVFVVNNNQWAISVPVAQQTADTRRVAIHVCRLPVDLRDHPLGGEVGQADADRVAMAFFGEIQNDHRGDARPVLLGDAGHEHATEHVGVHAGA